MIRAKDVAGPRTCKKILRACEKAGVSFKDLVLDGFMKAVNAGQFSNKPKPKSK